MKKILILTVTVFVLSVFMGCTTNDYVYSSSYVYVNGSSQDITVNSYYITNDGFLQDPEGKFVIRVGDSHTLRFVTEAGYQQPFGWLDYPLPSDYVIVSNGEKQFRNARGTYKDDDKLYRVENYEIIEESKRDRNRVCQYVFTDKDFENAAPMEP